MRYSLKATRTASICKNYTDSLLASKQILQCPKHIRSLFYTTL